MKNMLIYYLKKRLHIIGIITLSMVLFLAGAYLGTSFIRVLSSGAKVADNSPIGTITLFVGIITTIVPLYEFQFKMRKISIDQLYSLPIKREKLYLTKYIVGLVEIIVPFIISWLFILIVMLSKPNIFNFSYYFGYLGAMIIGIIVLYTTVCFIYTRNNTVIDGIICLALWIFFLPLIYEFFLGQVNSNFDASYMFIYTPITRISVIFDSGFSNLTYSLEAVNTSLVSFAIFGILGIIYFILFIILNKKDKSENSMQLSESWFSYKLLIPAYMILTQCIIEEITLYVLFMIGFYILYAIYKRSFKIGKKYLILYLIMLLLCTLIQII